MLKSRRIFVILLSPFITRNFRVTCLYVKMLKEYMVRERLGTPGVVRRVYLAITAKLAPTG